MHKERVAKLLMIRKEKTTRHEMKYHNKEYLLEKGKIKERHRHFEGGRAPGLKSLSTCNKERVATLLMIRKEKTPTYKVRGISSRTGKIKERHRHFKGGRAPG